MISLPFPPSANRYWRSVVRGGHPVVYKTKEASEYTQAVVWVCMANKVQPLDGPVGVDIVAYFDSKRGDLDNILKVLLDALQGSLYRDDKQIHHITAVRELDKDDPRVEVSVFSLTEEA